MVRASGTGRRQPSGEKGESLQRSKTARRVQTDRQGGASEARRGEEVGCSRAIGRAVGDDERRLWGARRAATSWEERGEREGEGEREREREREREKSEREVEWSGSEGESEEAAAAMNGDSSHVWGRPIN